MKKKVPFTVPAQFEAGPFTVTVKTDEELYRKTKEIGVAHVGKMEILLQPPSKDIGRELFFQCFCHEMVHIFLFAGGWHNHYTNEPLVESLAAMFYQMLKTKEGKA
jgi:hypothetical protein